MKDIVIVKSKTINNESVPVVIRVIKPSTGEDEEREITRSVIFENFQAEVSLEMAKALVKRNPNEFYIAESEGREISNRTKEIIKSSGERAAGFKCEVCEKESNTKAGLFAHIRLTHPNKWKEIKIAKVEE